MIKICKYKLMHQINDTKYQIMLEKIKRLKKTVICSSVA